MSDVLCNAYLTSGSSQSVLQDGARCQVDSFFLLPCMHGIFVLGHPHHTTIPASAATTTTLLPGRPTDNRDRVGGIPAASGGRNGDRDGQEEREKRNESTVNLRFVCALTMVDPPGLTSDAHCDEEGEEKGTRKIKNKRLHVDPLRLFHATLAYTLCALGLYAETSSSLCICCNLVSAWQEQRNPGDLCSGPFISSYHCHSIAS